MALFRCGAGSDFQLGSVEIQSHATLQAGKKYIYGAYTDASTTPPTVTVDTQYCEVISRVTDDFSSAGGATVAATEVLFKALSAVSLDTAVVAGSGTGFWVLTAID